MNIKTRIKQFFCRHQNVIESTKTDSITNNKFIIVTCEDCEYITLKHSISVSSHTTREALKILGKKLDFVDSQAIKDGDMGQPLKIRVRNT